MASPTKAPKQVVKVCGKCGNPIKVIIVMINHKKKTCYECSCGIYDRNGAKI